MKEFEIVTFKFNEKFELCGEKKVYDIGEFKNIKKAYETILRNAVSRVSSGVIADKDKNTIIFSNKPYIVKWLIKEKEDK